jgi:hypothetical protein
MPRPPKTDARGYGHRHQQLRKRWALRVARGDVRCSRCDELIDPHEPWDLGHDDLDRRKYNGPEHRRCNRAVVTHLKEALDMKAPRHSREW